MLIKISGDVMMTDSQSLIFELFDLYINIYISLGKPQFNIRLSSSSTQMCVREKICFIFLDSRLHFPLYIVSLSYKSI